MPELRDHFAMAALQGMLASGQDLGHMADATRHAYLWADWMMRSRNQLGAGDCAHSLCPGCRMATEGRS